MIIETTTTILLLLIGVLLAVNNYQLSRIRQALTKPTIVNNVPFTPPERPSRLYERGDRVRVLPHGWCPHFTGTVEFQEPNGKQCWVTRDGSCGPVWYKNHELEPESK